MAQFDPRWDLKADTDTIDEGSSTYIRLSINKDDVTDPETYELLDNQYLEFSFLITASGETFEERDFELQVGEDINNLVPIKSAGTGVRKIVGLHTVKFDKKSFELSGSTLSEDVYFMKLTCVDDGVWDGAESLTFLVQEINVVTLTSGQISNVEASGEMLNRTVKITYNATGEVWVTPNLTTWNDEMYSIGEIHYGSDSRLFVQAYGRKRMALDTDVGNEDGSDRVFVPTYRLLSLTDSQLPSDNRTGSGTYIIPDTSTAWPPTGEEMPLVIKDEIGNLISTGVKFNGNGQILGTFMYESDPIDGYIRAQIVSQKSYYTTERDAYYIGKRFKAYQMWVCPQDISYITGSTPKPGHLYQLKDTVVYPYVIKEEFVNTVSMTVFDENDWYDLGYYSEALGAGLIGQTRIFRMIVNGDTGDGINFITDSNLGEIHVGEYFGHTVYPKIEATGTLVTYVIADSSRDDIRKYNLDLAANGTLVGTAYAREQDFSANDDIELEFDVTANEKSGASITGTFKLRIIRGFGQNFLGAYLKPSTKFERKWFAAISTSLFSNQNYYRTVDDRYGLQKVPRMLLKENFVSYNYPYTTLADMKKTLRDSIIDTTGGSPVPEGIFAFTMGNYKIRSALDKNGNVLYDVLYREIHPQGTTVSVSISPYSYTTQDITALSEYFGLRQNIFQAVGEDTHNLLSDPTDLQNRGLVVSAIDGLSAEMIDTVPRYMNHPYLDDGVKAELLPVIPVAYFMPGQAEAFFTQLTQSNEHSTLVNEEFEITYVEFQYFFQEYALYVQNSYTIQIREQSRIGA